MKKSLFNSHKKNDKKSTNQWENGNAAGKIDELVKEWSEIEAISIGSEKQKRWAANIFAEACYRLATDVVSGQRTREEAEKILKVKDAKWWISNRKELGCN